MVHLLEISPELSVAQVKKLALRLAMTGGYELTLKADLSTAELRELALRYIEVLKEYQADNSEKRASNAYRILTLIQRHELTDTDTKLELQTLL